MPEENLIKAQAQLLGFYECYNGANIKDLCCSMGLTAEEFKKLIDNDDLSFLPDELYNEIAKYFNNLKQ